MRGPGIMNFKHGLKCKKYRTCISCGKTFVSRNLNPRFCSRECIRPREIKDRFLLCVKKTENCWYWTGVKNRGYGQMKVSELKKPKCRRAHRISYELFIGPVPAGAVIRHICDNPSCVNPSHLLSGSHKENSLDMVKRVRSSKRVGELNTRTKLLDSDIPLIRKLYQDGLLQSEIGLLYQLSKPAVSLIVNFKNWKHVPKD